MPTTESHYFVDEAGDLVLFDRRGRVIVGEEGCSKYFILGASCIEVPHEARQALEDLRSHVANDPYLKSIPSIQKTKIAFHAKDDCPEVRMQVYKLLQMMPIKLYAVVRRKMTVIEWVRRQNQANTEWRYNGNKLYDGCVKRLFENRLHLASTNIVTFARRGKSPRNEALSTALTQARERFERDSGRIVSSVNHVVANYPSHEPALQIIDYGLWALQRLYERHEERFFDFIRDKFTFILDVDDKRENERGVDYNDGSMLTVEKIKNSLKG